MFAAEIRRRRVCAATHKRALMDWMPPPDGIAAKAATFVVSYSTERAASKKLASSVSTLQGGLSGARRSSGWKRNLSKETHA
jgi:hypothetical protein